MPTDELIGQLRSAREEFFAVLDRISPASLTTPGLTGEWSARELIAHLGYWAGNAAETIHAVELGRDEVDLGGRGVDEINETVARVARQTDLRSVRKREAAAFEALVERVRALDPALLMVSLSDGQTLAQAIHEDGDEHYAEHAEELRRIVEAPHGG